MVPPPPLVAAAAVSIGWTLALEEVESTEPGTKDEVDDVAEDLVVVVEDDEEAAEVVVLTGNRGEGSVLDKSDLMKRKRVSMLSKS